MAKQQFQCIGSMTKKGMVHFEKDSLSNFIIIPKRLNPIKFQRRYEEMIIGVQVKQLMECYEQYIFPTIKEVLGQTQSDLPKLKEIIQERMSSDLSPTKKGQLTKKYTSLRNKLYGHGWMFRYENLDYNDHFSSLLYAIMKYDVIHNKKYHPNRNKVDWKNEEQLLTEEFGTLKGYFYDKDNIRNLIKNMLKSYHDTVKLPPENQPDYRELFDQFMDKYYKKSFYQIIPFA